MYSADEIESFIVLFLYILNLAQANFGRQWNRAGTYY